MPNAHAYMHNANNELGAACPKGHQKKRLPLKALLLSVVRKKGHRDSIETDYRYEATEALELFDEWFPEAERLQEENESGTRIWETRTLFLGSEVFLQIVFSIRKPPFEYDKDSDNFVILHHIRRRPWMHHLICYKNHYPHDFELNHTRAFRILFKDLRTLWRARSAAEAREARLEPCL